MKVSDALRKLGAAWRHDWSGFDGRTLRDQLDLAADALDKGEEIDPDLDWGVCPKHGVHLGIDDECGLCHD